MKLYRTITTAVLLCVLSLSAAADDLQANLRRHIDYLCSPHLEGRLAGSDGERLAAGYLYDQLEAVGLEMFTDRNGDTFTIVGTDGNRIVSQNIVGILEGEDHEVKIQKLLKQRDPVYAGFADIIVETGIKPFEDLVAEIIEKIGDKEKNS